MIYLDEYPLLQLAPIRIKSPDVNCDGSVSPTDLVEFAMTYGNCRADSAYDDRFDFNTDGCVSPADLSMFAMHWAHDIGTPSGSTPSASAEKATGIVRLRQAESEQQGALNQLLLSVDIDDIESFSALVLGLHIPASRIRFIDWKPGTHDSIISMVAPTTWNGKEIVFLGFVPRDRISIRNSIRLGTLAFSLTNPSGGGSILNDFKLVIGSALLPDGTALPLRNLVLTEVPFQTAVRDELGPCYPNPFNPATTITFSIADDSYIKLSIYDIHGHIVRSLVDGFMKRGQHKITWNGINDKNNPVASGIYFCRLQTRNFSAVKRLVLLK